MKKIIFALFFIIMSGFYYSIANTAGLYDGIWLASTGDYVSVHENNGQFILLELDDSDMTWEVYIGSMNGDKAIVKSVGSLNGIEATIEVIFTSETAAIGTLTSCRPVWIGYYCLYPVGSVFKYFKIW